MKKIYITGDKNQRFQGDISMIVVSEDVAKSLNFKPLSQNGYVVAIGETTGNKHVITASPTSKIEIAEDANGVFVRVLEGSGSLEGHLEHEPFLKVFTPLKRRLYWVGKKREYDPILKYRQIQD